MIQPGMLAVIRTSGEKVFVISVTEAGECEVRRPIAGQNGICHIVETFNVAELAEPLEFLLAEHDEMSELNKRIVARNQPGQLKKADAELVN